MPKVLGQVTGMLKETWKSWNAHDAPRIGAALAYYTTFSMAPILVIAIAVAGMVFGADAARDQVSDQMQGMLGATGAEAIEDMILNARYDGGGVVATIIGTVTLLLGSSSLFAELQSALNLMWGAPPPRKTGIMKMIRTRFLSFAMVLVIGFLLLVSLVISASLSALGDVLGGFVSTPVVAQTLNVVISLVVTTALFALIYKVLPDVKIAWSDVAVGAFVTALLFALGKQLIGLYLGNSSIASTYGAAGSLAVMLVWIYYTAQLILFGAQFTQVYAHRHGSKCPVATNAPALAAGATPQPNGR